jgi:hypothetical protein
VWNDFVLLQEQLATTQRVERAPLCRGHQPRSGTFGDAFFGPEFERSHQGILGSSSAMPLACDFFITATARFRLVYVFVVLEVGTRRIVYWNVTDHRPRPGRFNSAGSS